MNVRTKINPVKNTGLDEIMTLSLLLDFLETLLLSLLNSRKRYKMGIFKIYLTWNSEFHKVFGGTRFLKTHFRKMDKVRTKHHVKVKKKRGQV